MQKIFLACNVAHPEVSDGDNEMLNLWDECYQAKMGIAGKPMYVLQLDNIRGLRPPDALTAQAQLWEIITAELTRLGELKKSPGRDRPPRPRIGGGAGDVRRAARRAFCCVATRRRASASSTRPFRTS